MSLVYKAVIHSSVDPNGAVHTEAVYKGYGSSEWLRETEARRHPPSMCTFMRAVKPSSHPRLACSCKNLLWVSPCPERLLGGKHVLCM